MNQVNLLEEIYVCLRHDNPDYLKTATTVGTEALPHLKKIVAAKDQLAPKALLLEKMIRLYFDQPGKEKAEKKRRDKFSTGMRRISTTSPDHHIKGFASDMLRGKNRYDI